MNNNEDIIEFELSEEYIELIKLLKLLNLVESGAEAKIVVEEGEVEYNGNTEFRKRKKLRAGDFIKFQDYIVNII